MERVYWLSSILSFILTLVAVLTLVRKASAVKSKIESDSQLQQKDIDMLVKNKDKLRDKCNEVEGKLSQNDVVIMEIRTKLANIEGMLIEMKKSI